MLMGVMVWMMNRQEAQQTSVVPPQKSLWGELKQLALCCVNPIMVGVVALVGLGLYWVSPTTFLRFGPMLAIAICPLSMLLTMRNMTRHTRPASWTLEPKENKKLS